MEKEAIFLQDLAGNPSGQGSTILAVYVANHFAGFSSSRLLTEPTIKKNPIHEIREKGGGGGGESLTQQMCPNICRGMWGLFFCDIS